MFTRKTIFLFTLLLILSIVPVTVLAVSPPQEGGQDYIVQANDWLSKIADKYYGDVMAYPAIVDATNKMAETDDSYTVITNPDIIEIGQKLYIPEAGSTAALSNEEKAQALIKAFETGDTTTLAYVSDDTYIQHNLAVPDGKAVLNGFLAGGEPTGVMASTVRSFSDGDIVVLHNTYGGVWNNGTPQVAFDIFRFDDGLIVEHWDNLADIVDDGDGTSQTDGTVTPPANLDQTEANRTLLQNMGQDLFVDGNWANVRQYFDIDAYVQHSVNSGADGSFLAGIEGQTMPFYTSVEAVFVEGNFGLMLSQGPDIHQVDPDGTYAYYDLFRIEDGLIVEHWDIIQVIPPQSEWANENGKF